MVILEDVVCGAVELYLITLRGVSNILSTPFISMESRQEYAHGM